MEDAIWKWIGKSRGRRKIVISCGHELRSLTESFQIECERGDGGLLGAACDTDRHCEGGHSAANHRASAKAGRRPGKPQTWTDGIGFCLIESTVAGARKRKPSQRIELTGRYLGHRMSCISSRSRRSDTVLRGRVEAIYGAIVALVSGCFMLQTKTQIQCESRSGAPIVLNKAAIVMRISGA